MRYNPAIRMIPGPLHGKNLRKALPESRWNKIRQGLIAERGLKCETCGKTETESKRINAHEEWEYATEGQSGVASLVGVKLVCWLCHAVEHFGRTGSMVAKGALSERAIEDTVNHFCRVNGVRKEVFERHWMEAVEIWSRLTSITDWRVDFGPYAHLVEKRRHAKVERNAEADHRTIVVSPWVDFDGDGPLVRKRSGDRAAQRRRYRVRQLARRKSAGLEGR